MGLTNDDLRDMTLDSFLTICEIDVEESQRANGDGQSNVYQDMDSLAASL